MQRNRLADEVWRTMSELVIDNRDSWRRTAVEHLGLPLSRIRILRRLARRPMSVKQLAEAAILDAPAATVALNDLEARGLVVRRIVPNNRRCKVVSLTDKGRVVLSALDTIDNPAPAALAALSDEELGALRAILDKLLAAQPSNTAIAALCAPIPDAAPPRREPKPHDKIRSKDVAPP
jgi:DNA-binding MarR family transcriptional regulator